MLSSWDFIITWQWNNFTRRGGSGWGNFMLYFDSKLKQLWSFTKSNKDADFQNRFSCSLAVYACSRLVLEYNTCTVFSSLLFSALWLWIYRLAMFFIYACFSAEKIHIVERSHPFKNLFLSKIILRLRKCTYLLTLTLVSVSSKLRHNANNSERNLKQEVYNHDIFFKDNNKISKVVSSSLSKYFWLKSEGRK